MADMKNDWNRLKKQSAEYSAELQASLVSSGKLIDALETLEDWLAKVEPGLRETQPVDGDFDSVSMLIDAHEQLKSEIEHHELTLAQVARLIGEVSHADSVWIKPQLTGLQGRWDRLGRLCVIRDGALSRASERAEQFQNKLNDSLKRISELEDQLDAIATLIEENGLDEAKHQFGDLESDFSHLERTIKKTYDLGNSILANPHPSAVETVKHWLDSLGAAWNENQNWMNQIADQLKEAEHERNDNQSRLKELLAWLTETKQELDMRNDIDLPLNDLTALFNLKFEHEDFKAGFLTKQHDFDDIMRIYRKKGTTKVVTSPSKSRLPTSTTASPSRRQLEFTNPKAATLHGLWQNVWLISIDRQRAIEQAIENAESDFSFDEWRERYMKFIKHKKSRVMDQMRNMDKKGSGFITNDKFIKHMLDSNFRTTEREMRQVVKLFDINDDGRIDYYEFISSLNPRINSTLELNEADKIEDEVIREVAQCRCCDRFAIEQIADNKYRVSLF